MTEGEKLAQRWREWERKGMPMGFTPTEARLVVEEIERLSIIAYNLKWKHAEDCNCIQCAMF